MIEKKFRAWDDDKEEMIYGITEIYIRSDDTLEQMLNESMQYTGIADKNNKEIYEDDIVKALISLKEGTIYAIPHDTIDLVEGIGKVKYCSPSFIIDFQSWQIKLTSSCEIIGNIYENPELLEKK